MASSLDLRTGGVVAALGHLAIGQKLAGLDVTVAATYHRDETHPLVGQLAEHGIASTLIGPTLDRRLKWHPSISRVLTPLIAGADILHIHALWEEIEHQASRIAARLGKPTVISPHGMLDPWSLRQSQRLKRLYYALRLETNLKRASLLHFTTVTERALTAPLGLGIRAEVIPNAIDMGEFRDLPPRGEFRRTLPAIGDRRIILFLGRLHAKKGLDLLIPAFATASLPDAVLVIAGNDYTNYTPQVEAMIAAHGLADRVIMVGHLGGRGRLGAFVDAEVFVLPSYQENFGIAIIEALATGTPVIISDQVNLHEEIIKAGVGWITPLEVEGLRRVLEQVLEDEDGRRRAGALAHEFVARRFDRAEIGTIWKDKYAELIGGARV